MIYLDHAAATPVSKTALSAMEPFYGDQFFNPSAPYLPAKQVRSAYDGFKATIASCIGAKASDLVITSGATEANGLVFMKRQPGILALSIEHPSVLANADATIAVDPTGLINLDDLKAKLTPATTLVSVSIANHELGTIQPISKIAEIIKTERAARLRNSNPTPLYLHTDASQALNLLDLNVKRLGVDFMTLSSAKIYGPRGVGALYVARGIELQPLILGGGQENGLRSGTENVAGVAGFAAAIKKAHQSATAHQKHYQKLKDILRSELAKSPVPPLFLGHKKHQLASFLPVSFPGIDAERLIYLLEEQGVYVATGAACAASKGQKSHVLTAIGLSDTEIAGSLRLSLGALNTPENVADAGQKIVAAIASELERQKR